MKNKNVLALLLAVLTLSSASMAACAEKKDEQASNKSETTAAITEPAETTLHMPVVPEGTDFEGQDFIFLTWGPGINGEEWASYDIWVEKADGDTINDAVWTRNDKILQALNINITEIQSIAGQSVTSMAQRSIQSDSHDYDALMNGLQASATMAQNGHLYDLTEVSNIDFANEWWDQNAVEELAVAGRIYFATGDISLIDNDATWVLMFNKKMIDDLNMDVPYDLVRSDSWTLDKFTEMIKQGSVDMNGDGKWSEDTDRWGLISTKDNAQGMIYAAGERFIELDEDNFPVNAVNQDRLTRVVEALGEIHSDKNLALLGNFNTSSNAHKVREVFEQGRGLFYSEVMQCVTRMRASDTDFGLIPWPKFDENQSDYHNLIHKLVAQTVSVPITQPDLEKTGIVLEYMAGISMYELTPAYYDVALTAKQLRDNESAEMLDIILASRAYDLGYIYDWGGLCSSIANLINNGSTNVASTYAAAEKKLNKEIEKTIEKYTEDA